MFPCERKTRVVVIEGHIAPSAGVMAGAAIRTKLTIVLVIRSMTGVAVRRCTFIYTVDMTGGTLDIGVFA